MMRSDHKLLLLGGKPIGSCEIVAAAQEKGYYVIVADYLPKEESPAKLIADEAWELSTDDIAVLKKLSIAAGVDGVLAGVHEFNLQKMTVLSNELNLPCYCTEKQQLLCEDKSSFKKFCHDYGLNVAQEYSNDNTLLQDPSVYPLAVKPRDGSGSFGFSKCDTPDDLEEAVRYAETYSVCGEALIEEYINSNALIAQYTAHNGNIYFCGLTDKYSLPINEDGAPIMALQVAPSVHTEEYLCQVDPSMKKMLQALDVTEGPVWLELFYCDGRFVVNEIGYRFGGSLTYYLVKELYGIDQLDLLISYTMGQDCVFNYGESTFEGSYVIWPLHLKPGRITTIEGLNWLASQDEFVAFAQVHHEGEEIEDWGSAKQVFGYLHLKADSFSALLSFMKEVQQNVRVKDAHDNDMLFALFNPNEGSDQSDFVKEILVGVPNKERQ